MACYDAAPYTCTYDSAGAGSLPGGASPDYSVLATWEAASDNDLSGYSGPVILDCYDSQTHNDSINMAGATNTSATIYRHVRSASGCATPWAGTAGTGANFSGSAYGKLFYINENYARLSEVYVQNTYAHDSANQVAIYGNGSYVKILNCVAKGVNSGLANGVGIRVEGTDCLAFNCICNDSKLGLWAQPALGVSVYIVNCTALRNSNVGFYSASGFGTGVAWNCYGADNTNGDFAWYNATSWDSPSGWNASKDTTSSLSGVAGDNYKNSIDLITLGLMDSSGLALSNNCYAAGGAGNNYGRNPYNDFTATTDLNDFLKNDTDGEDASKKDIRGIARTNPDTADSSWNVGASQFTTAVVTGAGTVSVPIGASTGGTDRGAGTVSSFTGSALAGPNAGSGVFGTPGGYGIATVTTSNRGDGDFGVFSGSASAAQSISVNGAGTFTAFTGSAKTNLIANGEGVFDDTVLNGDLFVGAGTDGASGKGQDVEAFTASATATQSHVGNGAQEFTQFRGRATAIQGALCYGAGSFTTLFNPFLTGGGTTGAMANDQPIDQPTGDATGTVAHLATAAGLVSAFAASATADQERAVSTNNGAFTAFTGSATAYCNAVANGAGTIDPFVQAALATGGIGGDGGDGTGSTSRFSNYVLRFTR